MKTLLDQITAEFLTDEDSPATQQAKKIGLVSKGWGRWADPRTGKVTHKSTDGGVKLEPVGTTEPETEKEPTRDPTPGERSHGKKITARNREVAIDKFQELYGLEYTEEDEKRDDKVAEEHAELIREDDGMSRVLGLGEDRWIRGGGDAWQDDIISMDPNYRQALFDNVDKFFEENDVRVEAPVMYRGVRFEHTEHLDAFMEQMVPGETITLRPSGFSSDSSVALEFATEESGTHQDDYDAPQIRRMQNPVVVSVASQDPKGLQGVSISKAGSESLEYEREVITPTSSYRVVSVTEHEAHQPKIKYGDMSPSGHPYRVDKPSHTTSMIHIELEQIDEVSEQKTDRQKYIDKLNLFAFGGNMRNTLPSNTKKKEKKIKEGTLLEQIVRMFLGEQDRDLSLYAYSKTGGRGGKGQLIKYDTADNARDAIKNDPDRYPPEQAPDAVKADLDGEDDEKEKGDEKEPEDKKGDATPSDAEAQAAVDAAERERQDREETAETYRTLTNRQEELEADRASRVTAGGVGGGPAGHGEALFTEHSTTILKDGGLTGHVERVSDERRFKERYKELVDAERGVSGQTNIAKRREKIGKDLLDGEYDDKNPQHRECIAKYDAARHEYVEDALEKAKADEDHIFHLQNNKGFKGSDDAYRKWATAAFDASAVQTQKIAAGSTSIDPTRPHNFVQSDSRTEQTDEETLRLLQEGRDNTEEGSEDREYYERQIEMFESLDYHDTYVVGQDVNGRTNVYHISNKQGNNMKDPHRNGTPKNALEKIKGRLEGAVGEVAPKVVGVIDEGIQKLSDIKSTSSTSVIEDVDIDNDLVDLVNGLDSGYKCTIQEKANAVSTKSGKPITNSFSWWLREVKGMDDDQIKKELEDTKTVLQLTQEYMSFQRSRNKGKGKVTYKPFTKIFIKAGERSRDKGPKHKVADIKRAEKESVADAYQGLAQSLSAADKEMGFPDENGKNGPYTEAYIEFQLDALHYDKYIMNYDENASVQMGIYDATPTDFRESLADLVGFTDDLNTTAAREALMKQIKEQSRIDTTSQSIILTTGDGEDIVLAEDVWRTAGDVPKVATHLGKHIIGQLTDRAQKQNAKHFKSFCKLGESKTEAIRPLLRSLIVRELDRIKNGN